MNLKLEFQFSKAEILKEVDELKQQIDAMRPLPADVEGRVMQKLRLDWNYHSNAIEGNKLSYGETVAFLMEGITAKGKPLKDHLDIRGHNEAINFLLEIVKDTRPISEADIRALHKMILVEPYDSPAQTSDGLPTTKRITLGEYKTSPNHVKTATGEIHYYATPEETPAKMQELMQWLEEVERNDNIHPVIKAALFHHKFVAIHPFDDGNGRMSRILMNLILMQYGYPPVIVKLDDRTNYYSLLNRADKGDSWPFVEYVTELQQNSLKLYLKAATGGEIDEEEDIDKEIALMEIDLKGGMIAEKRRTKVSTNEVFMDTVLPLALKILIKIKSFDEYFFSHQHWLKFYFIENGKELSNVEYIVEGNKEAYERTLLATNRNVYKVGIDLKFEDYKNPINSFTIKSTIGFLFDDFYYKIFVDDRLLFSKLYHEKLSAMEQSTVIKNVLAQFKQQLDEGKKSPKHKS